MRGDNLDAGGGLYQIMPVNGMVSLEHRRGDWSNMFDLQAVDAKETEGAGVRLDAGVDNLANRNCALPLGGRYWIGDKAGKTQVPAMGRSVFSGLTFEF